MRKWRSHNVFLLYQGGGIPDDQLDKVFQYGFTTVGAQNTSAQVSSLDALSMFCSCPSPKKLFI
jgi:hypothetical protein